MMGRVMRPCASASTKQPNAPQAAASVGVARPIRMLPNTAKIRISGGSRATSVVHRRCRSEILPRLSRGGIGASPGRSQHETRI